MPPERPSPALVITPEVLSLPGGAQLLRFCDVTPLRPGSAGFDRLWNLHPPAFHTIVLHGRLVLTPRWQQAYGRDYAYSGSRNRALPVPASLLPALSWSRAHVDPRLNGLLVNWYDGERGHYIGAHRDSTAGLTNESPIVTLSLGEERVFRLRPYRGKGYRDFTVGDGDVLVIPAATNAAWTHEVPKFSGYRGRRISVTLRAYA